jgi:hypothetical protein
MDQNNDTVLNGEVIRPEAVPSYLPKELTEAILASDVTILIASSEDKEQRLSVRQVYATGLAQPEYVASHAYAKAIHDAHPDLLKAVRGEPTDAQRYRALREFAVLASQFPSRFEAVNAMLQRFEETSMAEDAAECTAIDHDRMADFLIHALLETAPPVVEQKPLAN